MRSPRHAHIHRSPGTRRPVGTGLPCQPLLHTGAGRRLGRSPRDGPGRRPPVPGHLLHRSARGHRHLDGRLLGGLVLCLVFPQALATQTGGIHAGRTVGRLREPSARVRSAGAPGASLGPTRVLFAFIWITYAAADFASEIFGSLFGRHTIHVWGLGDLNRKSWEGVGAGFLCALLVLGAIVWSQQLSASWYWLAVVLAVANPIVELLSPRGSDDFTMATFNALVCVAFGWWVF